MRRGTQEQPGDVQFALDSLYVIGQVRVCGGKESVLTAALAQVGWQYDGLYFFDTEGEFPGALLVRNGDEWWIGVDGTDSLSQIINQASGFIPLTTTDDGNQVNGEYWRGGKRLAGWVLSLGLPMPTYLHCYGHSFGGALSVCLARQAEKVGNIRSIDLTTFGAPKVGSSAFYREFRRTKWTAYENHGDPVPFLPALPILGIPVTFIAKQAFNANSRLYDKPPIPTVLLGGGIVSHTRDTLIEQAALRYLSEAIGSLPTELPYLGHTLVDYVAQIAAVKQRQDAIDAELRAAATPPIPAPPGTAPAANVFGGIAVWMPVLNPLYEVAVHHVPTQYLSHRLKATPQNEVVWMGRVVFTCSDRFRAAALVRYFNKFLGSTQTCDTYNATGFFASLESYIAEAANNVEFSPLVKVT